MDNLVLTRVVRDLDASLRKAYLRDVLQEGVHRFRLRFEREDHRMSLLVSLRPELPWIGRPAARPDRRRQPRSPFAALVSKTLKGHALASVVKPEVDRAVHLCFTSGDVLVAELATHGANLVLLDGSGLVSATARTPRTARERITPGAAYRTRSLPKGKFDPFRADPGEIDTFLERMAAEGEPAMEALRRHAFGIGTQGARLMVRESGSGPAGEVVARRLRQVESGESEPVIEAAGDPMVLAEEGRFDPAACLLLPWEPEEEPDPGILRIRRRDAASTAGLYHEAVERAAWLAERRRGLRSVLRRESDRLADVLVRVRRDLEAFSDPERYRIWGEAILAGLNDARRSGNTVLLPDPYDAGGNLMEVPARAGEPLTSVAEGHFRSHRRALRGLESARRRAASVEERREAIRSILDSLDEGGTLADARAVEDRMRAQGIPVGLEVRPRAARMPAGRARPRLEGVRIVRGRRDEILVGKGGGHNDRLTFKLATPDDFWFHALGVPGAHVVVRNPERKARPHRTTLVEAAGVAAWYSDSREHASAEVQWTRRKYVRRVRGGAPGKVIVKKFETIRVRPAIPAGDESGG